MSRGLGDVYKRQLVNRAAGRRDVAGVDAAHCFAAMASALRLQSNCGGVTYHEQEMLSAVAAAFELLAEGLGGGRALYYEHWREVLAPLVQSLALLGLQRPGTSSAGGAQ